MAALAAVSFPPDGSRPAPCPCPRPCTYRRWSAGRWKRRSAPPSPRRSTPLVLTVQQGFDGLPLRAADANSMLTLVRGSGWHRGISSLVRLVAMMPAMRRHAQHIALFARCRSATAAKASAFMVMMPWASGFPGGDGLFAHIHHHGIARQHQNGSDYFRSYCFTLVSSPFVGAGKAERLC